MVEIHQNDSQHLIVMSPNKSMDWATNKKILMAMFFVSMLIGISFAYMGAWLILPFAGLEVALVGLGMYYASWKLNFKQTISIQGNSLILQKGVYFPTLEWSWELSNTKVLRRASQYRMSAPSLFLKNFGETVEIGEFLNRKDKLKLRKALQKSGLPILNLASK